MNSSVIVEREGRVLRLRLNRPEKRNALSGDLCRALVDAAPSATGAILLEAEGDIFCAGMDLDDPTPAATAIHEQLFSLGWRTEVPIIAAVQGPAIGGGVGLVANAHIAVAAQGTQFGLTEVRLGLWPYIIWRSIVRALGERRALMLALTGRLFGSTDALQWGLVHEVVAPVELEDRALAIAHQVANASPESVRRGLKLWRETPSLSLEDAGRLALELRTENLQSPDFAEGIAAFREKRPPIWPSLQ